jgi:hypothetical protein
MTYHQQVERIDVYSQIDIIESQRVKFNETIISERLLLRLHFLREIHVSYTNVQTIAFKKTQNDNIISCA